MFDNFEPGDFAVQLAATIVGGLAVWLVKTMVSRVAQAKDWDMVLRAIGVAPPLLAMIAVLLALVATTQLLMNLSIPSLYKLGMTLLPIALSTYIVDFCYKRIVKSPNE